MCESYRPCIPKRQEKPEHPKHLSLLLLDCWQREYDKRPYKHFKLNVLDFEERMGRHFHFATDFKVVVEFLLNRKLTSVSLTGLDVIIKAEMLLDFASSVANLKRLELRLMFLPATFFLLLFANVHRTHLKELILEGTHLSVTAVAYLRLFIIESKYLQYLNVNSCSIDLSRFVYLADGVHKSPSLKRLEFDRLVGDGLTLDSQKLAHVVSSLIWQNKLEEISMKKCELVAQDMETIAEYLWSKCSRLRKLSVAQNIIGSDGAQYLFAAISNSGTLTHLDISSCGLGTHGGDVVAKYLSSCFQLVSLNIRYNDIGADTMNNILTMMKKRIQELTLKVYGNHFDAKSGKILNRLLKARVLQQKSIDITCTSDGDSDTYRIVPY